LKTIHDYRNFPYNISTQIVFRTLEYRDQIPEFAGMFQKEEAQFVEKREQKRMEFYRFWFRLFMMHLFTVDEHVFISTKGKIGVLRLRRKRITVCHGENYSLLS
jgi:16S rRNA (adenine1518-N6/adenine1519-N6)-dimethyltransferase